VLQDVSLRVGKGQVCAVIGPSGAGKSTLMRCATLLEHVDAGTVVYGELDLVRDGQYAPRETQAVIRRRFGLVFQNFNLFPHLSVLHNLTEAPILVMKMSKADARDKAAALLKKMGLADKAGAYPFQLSGGQQQRVAIARALMLGPEMLFFDEPTSALDPELTGEILKVIRGLAAEHMTMVIVTHEMAFARDVADHVLFMDGGAVVDEGTAEEILVHPANPRIQAFLQHFMG